MLRLAEAQRGLEDAVVAAHQAGAAIPAIGVAAGMDAFTVRDVLVREGVLPALQPKEAVSRS